LLANQVLVLMWSQWNLLYHSTYGKTISRTKAKEGIITQTLTSATLLHLLQKLQEFIMRVKHKVRKVPFFLLMMVITSFFHANHCVWWVVMSSWWLPLDALCGHALVGSYALSWQSSHTQNYRHLAAYTTLQNIPQHLP